MERLEVSSSNLKSVGYDSTSRILEIEFKSGGIYEYYDVPESVYLGLLGAESKGSYFHSTIKASYKYQRIG